MTARVALAGTGRGAALHAAVIDRTPGAELIAVTSDVAGRAAAFSRDLERPQLAAGDHRALNEIECDLIITATTPERAAEIIAGTAGVGTPVLVEAPIGLDAAALGEIIDRAADRWVGLACHLFHAPLWSAFNERASSLGPLGHVGFTVTRERPPDRDRSVWPGGVLSDLVVPNLALVSEFIDLHAVTNVEAAVRSPGEPNESWSIGLHLPDGRVGRVSASWSTALPFWDLQLAGANGALRLEFQPHPHLEDGGADIPSPAPSVDVTPPELAVFGYVQQLRSTLTNIAGGHPPARSLALASQIQAITEAAARSAGHPFDGLPRGAS